MTAPLTLPCDQAQLTATVARLWPDAAAVCGVDPAAVRCAPSLSGDLWAYGARATTREVTAALLALEHLARQLEDAGYEVRRDGSARVVLGWAGIRERVGRVSAERRVAELPPWHPAVEERRARLLRERQERDAATAAAPDAKLEHARGRR